MKWENENIDGKWKGISFLRMNKEFIYVSCK